MVLHGWMEFSTPLYTMSRRFCYRGGGRLISDSTGGSSLAPVVKILSRQITVFHYLLIPPFGKTNLDMFPSKPG